MLTATMIAPRKPALVVASIAAATFVLVTCRLLDLRSAALLAKLIASSGFLLLAWTVGATATSYGRWILAGLGLSWCGDLLLEGRGDDFFLAGLVSFLLAHLAYVAAFAGRGIESKRAAAALLIVGTMSWGVAAWLEPWLPPSLALPVHAYTAVISVMVVTAIGTTGRGAPLLVPAGALLFYLSDLSVAAGQFMQPDFPNYAWGLPCYYAGQVLLALSAQSRRSGPGSP